LRELRVLIRLRQVHRGHHAERDRDRCCEADDQQRAEHCITETTAGLERRGWKLRKNGRPEALAAVR
jgi:hypothetical protein